MNYKQAIILRDDLDMSEGKRIAQACHASLKSYKKVDKEVKDNWEREGAKKVALKYNNLKELKGRADEVDVPSALIKDAGLTELKPGTVTAMGVGPAHEKEVDKITGELELIK